MPPLVYEYPGWSIDKLRAQSGQRVHLLLDDPYRFVTVLLAPRTARHPPDPTGILGEYVLHCLDSPCYHAAGPLGEGPLVEIEELGVTCIECPWHRYLVDLETGGEILLEADPSLLYEDPTKRSPLQPLTVHDKGVVPVRGKKDRQRIHQAELVPDPRSRAERQEAGEDEASLTHPFILKITVAAEEEMKRRPVRSDGSATSLKNGGMCMQIRDIKSKGLDQLGT